MKWRARIAIEVEFDAADANEAGSLFPVLQAVQSYGGYPIISRLAQIYVSPAPEPDAANPEDAS